MYPFVRLALETRRGRRTTGAGFLDPYVSHHRCWPQDLDIFMEMNNGRILTLFDLGRFGIGARVGLLDALKRNRWGLAVAGGSTRYRKRIKLGQRFRMVTRCPGWDDRWLYMEQSMWLGDTCAAHALLRTAVTGRDGIVPVPRLMEALGVDTPSPDLPGWVTDWIAADAGRVWPPVGGGSG